MLAVAAGLAFGLMAGPVAAAEKAAPAAKAEAFDGYTDIILGKKDAPVTVIEYASMTCSHCAQFQKDVFPAFKKAWIDSGKAKYIMRHFVLNGPDLIASMIARCAPEDRYYAFVDLLLTQQDKWIPGWQAIGKPADDASPYDLAESAGMDKFVRPMGFTEARLKACLTSDKVRNDLLKLRMEGVEKYQIKGTPTIIINDKVFEGDHTFEAFDKALKEAK